MLIRLAGHFIDNPAHIDKLICIKGLPEEWFFRENKKYQGKELIAPWLPDIESNIPQSIRHLCDTLEVIRIFPPIEKGREYIVDRFNIIGVRFDYMTESGQTTWDKIERYLERMVPRDQMVPKPVLVAPNQKSEFNPHEARRTTRGSLEFRPAEVPMIDLGIREETTLVIPSSVSMTTSQSASVVLTEEKPKKEPKEVFKCDECDKKFKKDGFLRLHKLRGHPKEVEKKEEIKEPAGV